MAIIRACSYEATIETPKDPTTYSAVLVTFQQDGTNLINLTEDDISISDNKIIVQLDQEQTKLFACGKKALLQIRCYASQYDAPGSAVWAIDVCPALNDEVLPNE